MLETCENRDSLLWYL